MAISPENELTVRKALADTIATVPEAGFVQPSPLYCSSIEDFWAVHDPSIDTNDEIDAARIAGCWLYPLQFVDDFSSGCIDSPLVNVTYEAYLFRQYGLEREDENSMPVIFDSEVLLNHNLFVAAWLGIKAAFQGNRNIAGLPDGMFSLAKTTSTVQYAFIQNFAACEFVPGAAGFAVRLQQTVRLLLAPA